ncbi:conserved hypothetical protein [Coccidioides posadasii str. Silveira]|uniref:Uncharacterized protein n=1 Tax=Coccidioides posadasii (strain RMSCC 757 / Silveira) TaxID=443226 RepID=E9D8L5_COCPS|nr:conserved hypothetical protein [Coccidioides posadasii str. Silveira]
MQGHRRSNDSTEGIIIDLQPQQHSAPVTVKIARSIPGRFIHVNLTKFNGINCCFFSDVPLCSWRRVWVPQHFKPDRRMNSEYGMDIDDWSRLGRKSSVEIFTVG